MDEQLKARLIGAAILVLIAVLLVPELLSGRKPVAPAEPEAGAAPGTRSFTIELGGSGAQPAGDAVPLEEPAREAESTDSPAVAVDGPGEAPVQTSELPAAPDPRGPEGAVPAAGADAPATAASALPEKAADDAPPAAAVGQQPAGAWAVQVGAFGSEKSARKLADRLAGDGFDVFVTPMSRSGKTLHRVRVGPVPERADAERLAARLKERKLPAAVVAND